MVETDRYVLKTISCVLIRQLQGVVWSHLWFFGQFLRAKFSHFNWNLCNKEFPVKAKAFSTQISQQVPVSQIYFVNQ